MGDLDTLVSNPLASDSGFAPGRWWANLHRDSWRGSFGGTRTRGLSWRGRALKGRRRPFVALRIPWQLIPSSWSPPFNRGSSW
jgi:hypothetical protein